MDSIGFISLLQNWNDGTMEYWNVGFLKCGFILKNRITFNIEQNSQSLNKP
jgi:hypothetical protein